MMAWDTESTKQKIKNAALVEFAAYGPDGTTVERIAKRAKVNKERIYNYFGNNKSSSGAFCAKSSNKSPKPLVSRHLPQKILVITPDACTTTTVNIPI